MLNISKQPKVKTKTRHLASFHFAVQKMLKKTNFSHNKISLKILMNFALIGSDKGNCVPEKNLKAPHRPLVNDTNISLSTASFFCP